MSFLILDFLRFVRCL